MKIQNINTRLTSASMTSTGRVAVNKFLSIVNEISYINSKNELSITYNNIKDYKCISNSNQNNLEN